MSDIKVNWFEIPVSDEDQAEKCYFALLDRPVGHFALLMVPDGNRVGLHCGK